MPLYGDEELILCRMGLAKCYALIHSIAEREGVSCTWADEGPDGAFADLEKARAIILSQVR